MATASGGIVLGDLRVHEASRALSCVSRSSPSEFLPSSSHVCASRFRVRCSWRARGGTRAHVSVQLREAGSVSETLLEGIAQDLFSDKDNWAHEHSSHFPSDNGKEVVPSLDIPSSASCPSDEVVLDRSMSSYIQAISALQRQRSSPNVAETSNRTTRVENSVVVEERPAIKAVGRPVFRNVYVSTTGQHPGRGGKGQKTTKKDRYVSESVRDSKQISISLVKSLDALSPEIPVHHLLEQSRLKFTSREITFILNSLMDQDNVLEAFKWMHENGKTRGNVFAYNILFKILGSRQEWSRINELLGKMEEDECEPGHYTFNTLIMSASKANSAHYTKKFFQMMLKKGVSPTKSTYSMMMLLYHRYGNVTEAEGLFSHMLQRKVQVVTAYSVMIALYNRDGLFEKSEQIMKDMRLNNVVPDRDNWLKQLNTYGQQGKIKEAEHIMDTVEKLGMSLGVVGYNSMITAYGKAGLYDQAVRLVEKMRKGDLEPDEVTYSCMIGACGRVGKLADALAWFEEMKRLGIRPASSNFNTLINLHGKAGDVQGIVRVVADMKRFGFNPDWQTLDAVVRAYDRAGQIKEVTLVLGLLRDAGWVEETGSYGTLLHVYLKCNLQKEAFGVFLSMRKAGMAPKEYMCRSLICACRDAEMFEDAKYVFKEMQVAGVIPSLESLCTMINVYGLKGDVKEAEELFESLRSSVRRLDIFAYNVMINVYMRSEMAEEAIRIFKLMEEEDKLLPDSYTYHSMLRMCQKCNLPEQAEQIYWRLRNSDVELDEIMCNCVINTCARFLPLEEVHKLFQEMIDLGYLPYNITFNVMIDLYGKAGMPKRAHKALKLAQRYGAADKISFSTLIHAYGKKQDFPNMETAFWEMQIAGYGSSLEAYNSVLDAYGKAGQMEKVADVLTRMEKSGVRMDLSSYNILINIYGRNYMLAEMEALFHTMQEEGFRPDRWTYNTMIRTFGYADYPDKALHWFKTMQDAGILPDGITYMILVSTFERAGNLDEAARWSLWMMQEGFTR